MSELVYVPFSQFHHYKGKRVQNIAGFVNEMSKTTNKFWPRGVLWRQIDNEKDKLLLLLMMGDRNASKAG